MAKLTPAQRRVLAALNEGGYLLVTQGQVWLCSQRDGDSRVRWSTLRGLDERGWVYDWTARHGRVYRITDAGREALAHA